MFRRGSLHGPLRRSQFSQVLRREVPLFPPAASAGPKESASIAACSWIGLDWVGLRRSGGRTDLSDIPDGGGRGSGAGGSAGKAPQVAARAAAGARGGKDRESAFCNGRPAGSPRWNSVATAYGPGMLETIRLLGADFRGRIVLDVGGGERPVLIGGSEGVGQGQVVRHLGVDTQVLHAGRRKPWNNHHRLLGLRQGGR
jgi:hypothetical protein